jgi:hypothetical protein
MKKENSESCGTPRLSLDEQNTLSESLHYIDGVFELLFAGAPNIGETDPESIRWVFMNAQQKLREIREFTERLTATT